MAQDLVPGRYRLLDLLARGGMGEVYHGEDLRLGRRVAIKLVTEARREDPDARRRLLREAQVAAALDHPCICPVYDSGETPDGRAYFVMPFVEGQTLAALMAADAVSPRQSFGILLQVTEALALAHRHGLVHRDVKPANIIVTSSGAPKLLDLGIAKVVSWPREWSEAATASGATADGRIAGTPAYMSPEQIQQRPLDGRSDLFAVGAVLYEALTGRRAFTGATTIETIGSVLHSTPPAPSTVRPELGDRYDALCERLLARRPEDRFQSAEEALGAMRMLLPDATTGGGAAGADASGRLAGKERRTPRWPSAAVPALVGVLLLTGTSGLWFLTRPRGLPPVPESAGRWYARGTEAIREGAYLSGRAALEQSISLFPSNPLAYARLAEADAELDDERSAQARLVRVAALVPNEDVLPATERLRLKAVRALVLRDVDASVAVYQDLVTRRPDEAGAWLDLGRAQEAAGRTGQARQSYEAAIRRDREYAAAYLRLGSAEGLESRREAAMAAFAEAERLYRAASDVEGETEVLIRRGRVLDAFGDVAAARPNLDRAVALAEQSDRTYQQVRARLALSSVTAAAGQFGEAERLASTAVRDALTSGLETVAADGLVDLAAIILSDRPKDAAAELDQAMQLAARRGARRTLARVRLQQAELDERSGRPRDALRRVEEILPFLKENRYRGLELVSGSIAARAHTALDEWSLARETASGALEMARSLGNEAQQAIAASSLALADTGLGQYPEALRLRQEVVAIHRRQGDRELLPYDLANLADVLIRLGRLEAADVVLGEIDAGVAAGLESYAGRARRVAYLHALSSATLLHCETALRFTQQVASLGPASESAALLAPAVAAFCAPRRRGAAPRIVMPPESDRALSREMYYWLAVAALRRGDDAAALTAAAAGLSLVGRLENDEVRWRLTASAAAAAHRLGQASRAQELEEAARTALERLRAGWKSDVETYERRADLLELRKRINLG